MLGQFHFIRPWWFLALIPAIILIIFSYKKINVPQNNWAKYCDSHLLEHLLSTHVGKASLWLPAMLFTTWVFMILALTGPSWSHYETPVYQKNIARVIALDVSQSMDATDMLPSRMERAKYKVLDILHAIKEGQTGMIVFSSQAFVVSPLTSDSNTIASMVPVIDSSIVPVQGSDIDAALNKSSQLLKGAGYTRGQIILVTDSAPSEDAITTASKLASQGYLISILGIGKISDDKLQNSSSVADSNGNMRVEDLEVSALERLAKAGDGKYVQFSGDNSDTEELLASYSGSDLNNQPSKQTQTENLWKDEGVYLIWLIMILVLFISRKGWLEKIC